MKMEGSGAGAALMKIKSFGLGARAIFMKRKSARAGAVLFLRLRSPGKSQPFTVGVGL